MEQYIFEYGIERKIRKILKIHSITRTEVLGAWIIFIRI